MKAIEFGDDFERHEKNGDFTFPNEMAALRRFLESDQAKFNIDFFTLEKLWYAFSETRCANFLTVDNETYSAFKEWVRDISKLSLGMAVSVDMMALHMINLYRSWMRNMDNLTALMKVK